MLRMRPSMAFAASPARAAVLVVLLILCWSLGHIVPRYRPVESPVKVETLRPAPRPAVNASKVALLIEPRPLPHLAAQIVHMISVVPPDWRFVFLGTRESVFSVGRAYAMRSQRAAGKLEVVEVRTPWSISSKEHVFRALTDGRFYDEYLPGAEWVLKYEYDSLLCANSEVSLDDWLVWDWAGAARREDSRFSGNGGLSLRRVSVVKRVLGFQARRNDSEPEDVWFGKRVAVLPGARVAARSDGVLSVEDVYSYAERPMGFHVRGGGAGLDQGVWGDGKLRRGMLEYCPELSIIMDMKLERERCPDDDGEGHRVAEAAAAAEVLPGVDVRYAVLDREGRRTEREDVVVGPPEPPPLPLPRVSIIYPW